MLGFGANKHKGKIGVDKNMFRQISIKLHENARDESLGKSVERVEIPMYCKEPEIRILTNVGSVSQQARATASTVSASAPPYNSHAFSPFASAPYSNSYDMQAYQTSEFPVKSDDQESETSTLYGKNDLQNSWQFDQCSSTYPNHNIDYSNHSEYPPRRLSSSEFPPRCESALGYKASYLQKRHSANELMFSHSSKPHALNSPQIRLLTDYFSMLSNGEVEQPSLENSIYPPLPPQSSLDLSLESYPIAQDILDIKAPTLRAYKSDDTLCAKKNSNGSLC